MRAIVQFLQSRKRFAAYFEIGELQRVRQDSAYRARNKRDRNMRQVICSLKTADCYNSKVIQATMGAIAHVNIYYSNLKDFLETAHRQQIKVYGTFLEGDNIYQSALLPDGIIVMGNEGNGISPDIEKLIDHKLFIPTFATNGQNVESLNVSVAAAIICSEFKRKTI